MSQVNVPVCQIVPVEAERKVLRERLRRCVINRTASRPIVKLFVCQSCGNVLYFENRTCGRCGHQLAFLPEKVTLSAIEGDGAGWKTLAD
jgi:uncharacterized paraquat-inducible protein A